MLGLREHGQKAGCDGADREFDHTVGQCSGVICPEPDCPENEQAVDVGCDGAGPEFDHTVDQPCHVAAAVLATTLCWLCGVPMVF